MSNSLLKFDTDHKQLLIGVDEVGRGCLAGPVYAAAVHVSNPKKLMKSDWTEEVNDSKKITKTKRIQIAEKLKENCIWNVASASVDEINEFGILGATLLAMKRCSENIIESISVKNKKKNLLVLVDGISKIKNFEHPQKTVKKGDETSFHIAAASIIAKNARDEYMSELSKSYEEYKWSQNVGYGTAAHREAIIRFGSNKHHRVKFLRKILGESARGSNEDEKVKKKSNGIKQKKLKLVVK